MIRRKRREVDIYPPTRQREALLAFRDALGCRDNALRRDECGDWCIEGRFGHIYAIPGTLDRPGCEGFQIYFRGAAEFEEPPRGSKGWAECKKAMPFAEVTANGDAEGMLFLDHMPDQAEAKIIRDKLYIAKKREISDDERARLAAFGFRSRVETPFSAPENPSDEANHPKGVRGKRAVGDDSHGPKG